jgi:hypothetical protein
MGPDSESHAHYAIIRIKAQTPNGVRREQLAAGKNGVDLGLPCRIWKGSQCRSACQEGGREAALHNQAHP